MNQRDLDAIAGLSESLDTLEKKLDKVGSSLLEKLLVAVITFLAIGVLSTIRTVNTIQDTYRTGEQIIQDRDAAIDRALVQHRREHQP